jgi:predicted nucleic acid-binding protein
MLVVDASVVADLLLGVPDRERLLDRLAQADALFAPELLDVEVLHVLRRLSARGVLSPARGADAVALLAAFPATRVGHDALRDRVWALRGALTAYDATYVALAEGLGAPLLTRDRRLSRGAAGTRAMVEVL